MADRLYERHLRDLGKNATAEWWSSHTMEASLRDLALLAVTLAALVAGGWAAKRVDAPLVGEIVVGMLLGPSGLVPTLPGYAVRAVFLVGEMGLVLLVMEGGLSVDVPSLRRVGVVACVIAVAGTALPIALGTAFMVAAGFDATTGVVAGTALSSTSIGMATRLMATFDELSTPLGALVCVAAMVDDVLSLVILAIISEGLEGHRRRRQSRASAAAAGVGLRRRRRRRRSSCARFRRRGARDPRTRRAQRRVALAAMLDGAASTVASGTAGSTPARRVRGRERSPRRANEAWAANERVNAWLYSVFFLSVGFRIPTRDIFRLGGFGLGIGYAVPAIVGKLVTGFLVGGDVRKALVVGGQWTRRAGLRQAHPRSKTGSSPSAVRRVVWASAATLASPMCMRGALLRWKRRDEAHARASGAGHEEDEEDASALVRRGAEGFTAAATGRRARKPSRERDDARETRDAY